MVQNSKTMKECKVKQLPPPLATQLSWRATSIIMEHMLAGAFVGVVDVLLWDFQACSEVDIVVE